MILILGGTTEGRAAVKVADKAGKPYYYSTKGTLQEVNCAHGIRLTGALDAVGMEAFCREKAIRLLIDAAHPFASALHDTVATVANTLQLPVIRYERHYPAWEKEWIACRDYPDAIRQLKEKAVHTVLALTGVNTIAPLRPLWETVECRFRILDREESIRIAEKQGFPLDHLLFYTGKAGEEDYWIEHLQPDAMLTKESGSSGHFEQKTEAARRHEIPLFVIRRPPLPSTFHTVYGEDGLRKQIERLLPGFFPLRSGYTTGTCATAAAKAALLALLTGHIQKESSITLPSGETVTLPVASTEWTTPSTNDAETERKEPAASCQVIKDAGDDPDVTNGCTVVARVHIRTILATSDAPIVLFKGGEGIGTVTLPGLGLAIGEPAINATPRRMIEQELKNVLETKGILPERVRPKDNTCLEITVTLSVPGGKKLAARTFNPKLGIVGGISIIGTSGIVRPFSSDAFIASIRKEAEVARAVGCQALVLNSGAKSERFIKAYIAGSSCPGLSVLPSQAFIHYGNFIGETLKIASALGFQRIILGVMIGKAVKLAEGALDTHSKKVVMNKAFLQGLAREAGCTCDTVEAIGRLTLARELWQLLSIPKQASFFPLLLRHCLSHCRPLLPQSALTLLLIAEDGTIPYRIDE